MILLNKLKNRLLFLTVLFTISFQTFAQIDGASLFKTNCTACHSIGEGRLVGPDLQGVTDRRDAEWLKSWINDNAAFRKSGDKDAIAIFEEYKGSVMAAFYFEDEEMDALLSYLANPPVEEVPISKSNDSLSTQEEGMSNNIKLIIFLILLFVVITVLVSIKNSLKESLSQDTETVSESITIFVSKNRNKFIIGLGLFIFILYIIFNLLMGVGVVEKYQPDQPIAFSHTIHAGDNGIDCNYCHSSARDSKHSGIPSVNVCMNCHANIVEGTNTGKKEIQKIYDAIGYNPDTREYIKDYIQKPIEWIRVHNLPDLTYFNHSQHVTVGGLECQQCHANMQEKTVGQVATMEELNNQENNIKDGIEFDHPTLTMGWCIDCHRQKEVNMENNDYYTEMHDKLKAKNDNGKITVEMIGGLECGKCHY